MLTPLTRRLDRKDEGFTLIELLVVVVIIGILIAIAIPLYISYQKGANDKSAQSDLRGAIPVLEQCSADNNGYPATADVPATGGTLGASCSTQTIKVSNGTSLTYTFTPATSSTAAFYKLTSTNGKGSGKTYCYNSSVGGPVKSASTC